MKENNEYSEAQQSVSFTIIYDNSKYEFLAANQQIRDEWMAAVQAACAVCGNAKIGQKQGDADNNAVSRSQCSRDVQKRHEVEASNLHVVN
jgi:hypothetical protein